MFFSGREGVHRLDQANGADGDEVLQIDAGGFKLSGDVHHQPQVVDDQLLPRVLVLTGKAFKKILLLLPTQRRRQGLCAVYVVQLPAESSLELCKQSPQAAADFA